MSTSSPGAPGSVAADLLLLAVGHRSSWSTRGPVHLVVAAGSMADDLLTGTPLETMGSDRAAVAEHLVGTSRQRCDDVTAALAAAGAVAPLRTKVMGLFPRDGLQVLQPWARERAATRLVDASRQGARPAPADAALAAVASVGGLARVHVPVPRSERTALQARVNALALHTGPAVAEVVMALRQALRRAGDSGDAAVLFVPGSDRDGYGDGGGQGDSSSGGGDGGGGDGGGGDGGGGGGD